MQPIRILHVVVNMNRGGAETLIMNIYRQIDRSRVQFDFLTCQQGIFDAEIASMGAKIHRVPYVTEGGPVKYKKALEQFFRAHPEYAIVHSHMDKMSGFVLQAAKRCGVPLRIAHSHNTRSEGNVLSKSLKWFAGKMLLQTATHYFACSKEASKWLFKHQSKNVRLLKNGIDSQLFKPSMEYRAKIRSEWHIAEDSLVVGHIGRFYHQKNHRFLIDIFSEMIRIHPNSFLVLVGDGPLRKKMEDKANSKLLSNRVIFLGVKENVHEIMQAFDIMVFPSLHEGFPMTLIEAQSASVPCVISDRITNEIDMGAGLIRYESLKMPPLSWAIQALCFDQMKKGSAADIKKKGYDIEQTAKWMENFYLSETQNLNADRRKIG